MKHKKNKKQNTHPFCHTGTNWEWITSCFTMFDSGCQNAYTYSMNRSGCSDTSFFFFFLWNEPKAVEVKYFRVNHIKKKKKIKPETFKRWCQVFALLIEFAPFVKCQHYCARWLYPKHWCMDIFTGKFLKSCKEKDLRLLKPLALQPVEEIGSKSCQDADCEFFLLPPTHSNDISYMCLFFFSSRVQFLHQRP